MRRGAVLLLMVMLTAAGCSSSRTPARDPGKVVLPVKQISVPGRLYATNPEAGFRAS